MIKIFTNKHFLTHFLVFVSFALVSVVVFNPILKEEALFQSDIIQYNGMANERNQTRNNEGKEVYWTNAAFGGMYTYQLGAQYNAQFIKSIDRFIRFLPRPADYLFLYLISFYVLMLVLNIDFRIAILGALAFGFSTYFLIIIDVGHNAKAHAIGYFPLLLSGFLLLFEKSKWLIGILLSSFGWALELVANHYQMTYYFGFLLLIAGLFYLYEAIKTQNFKPFIKASYLFLTSLIIGILCNAATLITTKMYSEWSTRGTSELMLDADGRKKENISGLDYEYITQYSYGIGESLNLIFPRFYGGSNAEPLSDNSSTFNYLKRLGATNKQARDFTQRAPLYWGNQPIIAAPAYLGILVIFLALLGFSMKMRRLNKILWITTVVSLMLSWGKNFDILTSFFIDYFPLYNKFRAVSSIQVLIEFCLPILAVVGLSDYLKNPNQKKLLKTSGGLVILGVLLLFGRGLFLFSGLNDMYYAQNFGAGFVEALIDDRKSVYSNDILMGIILVASMTSLIWLQTNAKLKNGFLFYIGCGILVLFDLGRVGDRYFTSDDWVSRNKIETPFEETVVDQAIKKDKSYYRVYNLNEGLNGAKTSYFHNSLGGYHAAKPNYVQNLFDYHIFNGNPQIINMLNVKYLINQTEEGPGYSLNEDNLGAAWLVDSLVVAKNADEAIKALADIELSNTAIIQNPSKQFSISPSIKSNEYKSLKSVSHSADLHVYDYQSDVNSFVIFSEWYPMISTEDWQIFVNNEPISMERVNYALRGAFLPAGKYQIEMRFNPIIVSKAETAHWFGHIILLFLISFYAYNFVKQKQA
tara:strand:- start:3687 stop:6113 length:2427 start_codon:yes stop_codon:yes gene_type:complete